MISLALIVLFWVSAAVWILVKLFVRDKPQEE